MPATLTAAVIDIARSMSDPKTLPQAQDLAEEFRALLSTATPADLASPLGVALAALNPESFRTLQGAKESIFAAVLLAAPTAQEAAVTPPPSPALRETTAVRSALAARAFHSVGQASNIASHLHGALEDATPADRNSPLGRAIKAFPRNPRTVPEANAALVMLRDAVGLKTPVMATSPKPATASVPVPSLVAQFKALPPGPARHQFHEQHAEALRREMAETAAPKIPTVAGDYDKDRPAYLRNLLQVYGELPKFGPIRAEFFAKHERHLFEAKRLVDREARQRAAASS